MEFIDLETVYIFLFIILMLSIVENVIKYYKS